MKILVTGAAGFIGCHVCRALLGRSDEVIGLDNFDSFYDRSLKEDNLAWAAKAGRLIFIEGNILNPKALDSCFTATSFNLDAVIHLAALAGVRPSLADPQRYMEVNVGGTGQVLEAMRRHDVKRLIFASSSSVYGNKAKAPFREDEHVDSPISPYAASKTAGELLAHVYNNLFGFDIHCLRFFTVYGPRQRPDLAIRKFAELMIKGKPIPVYGDGSQKRDFTYIDDIVSGVLASLDNLKGFRIFNLGRGQPVTVSHLVECIGKALNIQPILEIFPWQPGDVEQTEASIERAVIELGYQPTTSLEDGLERFAAWLESKS